MPDIDTELKQVRDEVYDADFQRSLEAIAAERTGRPAAEAMLGRAIEHAATVCGIEDTLVALYRAVEVLSRMNSTEGSA